MIDPKPDNQPAFPQQTQMMSFRQKPDGTTESEPVGHPVMRGGLTMRDYFMAHAPAEPQPWFVPVMPEKPSLPDKHKELSEEERRQLDDDFPDIAPSECSPNLLDFTQRMSTAFKARQVWETEFAKQRCVQWPAAWADAMLRARAA
ncbi:MAG: hypothetical protein U0800_12655 [Isosphaeraceae bacterium]